MKLDKGEEHHSTREKKHIGEARQNVEYWVDDTDSHPARTRPDLASQGLILEGRPPLLPVALESVCPRGNAEQWDQPGSELVRSAFDFLLGHTIFIFHSEQFYT